MIYLDNAATTEPLYQKTDVLWGNASSLYEIGDISKKILNTCNDMISNMFNVDKECVIFTSGATEANNWVIKNIIEKKRLENKEELPHVIISSIEHPSVMNVVKYYADKNLINVSYLLTDREGHVLDQELEHLITKNTCLISCMYANNEIGSIQPIARIGSFCNKHEIYFHVDATQAVGKTEIDMQLNNIDFLTFSGHKFHGPKGVGCLICNGLSLLDYIGPFLIGGHQQKGYRAGTENVNDIHNMTMALTSRINIHGYQDIANKNKEFNSYIEQKLKDTFDKDIYIINSYDYLMPVFNVSFKDISGEYIVQELNKHNIYISTGSACTSGNLEPSHVLQAIQCPNDYIQGTIRISFDPYMNTFEDIDELFEILKEII